MIAQHASVQLEINVWRWWWLATLAFVIGLFALAPAVLLERAYAPAAGVQFAARGGTIWNGDGVVSVATDSTPLTVPITWQFDPLALFRLRLGFRVSANGQALDGNSHLGLRFGSLEIRDSAVTADARLLSAAHRLAAVFTPQGKLRLQQENGESLIIAAPVGADGSWRVDGTMRLFAEQFILGSVVNAAIGTHEIALSATGSTINFTIPRSSGALKLEGSGRLTLAPPRGFTFSGFATAASDAPATLKQLGVVLPDGRQRIEVNTPW
jgi:hypothetical protein